MNPTDRALSKRDRDRRYAEKSRLQSELVRRFGDAVRVRRDGSDERVVAFEVGELRGDACHAIVDNLDEDARAWVLRQLDEQSHGPPSAPGGLHARGPVEEERDDGARNDDPDALLARGNLALKAYDYDSARDAFQRAFHASQGAEPAARALMGFLVDGLCADEEALALRAKLSRDVARTNEIRALCALAAARTGDRKLAGTLLVGLDSPRRADALVALGHLELASGNIEASRGHARDALVAEVGHLGAQALLEEIARRARDATRTLDSQLEAAIASGALDDIESLSSQILRQYPESESAKRAVRTVAERRRTLETEARIAAADEAEKRGDLDTALAEIGAAVRLAPSDAASRRAADLAQRIRARREGHRADGLVQALAAADRDEAVRALAREEAAVRGAVAARDAGIDVRAADRLATAGLRAADAADAAIALRRAADLSARDPASALALLQRHPRVLEHLDEARDLERTMQEQVAEATRRRTIETILRAERRLEDGDAEGAMEEIATIAGAQLRNLDRADGERAARVTTLAHLRIKAAMRDREHARMSESDPVSARAWARRLALHGPEDERARWSAAAEALNGDVDRAFRIWRGGSEPAPDPASPSSLDVGWPLEGALIGQDIKTWIDASGTALLLFRDAEHWLFVAIIDLPTRRVLNRFSLRLPCPADHPLGRWTSRGTICFVGPTGYVLEVEPVAADVVRWVPGSTAGLVHEDADLLGDRYLWVTDRKAGETTERTRVHDLDRPGARREVHGEFFREAQGSEGPLVFMSSADEELVIHEANGALRLRLPMPGLGAAGAVAAAPRPLPPSGGALVVFANGESDDYDQLYATRVVVDGRPARPGPRLALDLDAERAWDARTALGAAVTFATGMGREGDARYLLVLDASGERVEIVSRTETPAMALAGDVDSRIVVALVPSDGKLEIVALVRGDNRFTTDLGARLALPIVEPHFEDDEKLGVRADDPLLDEARRRLAACDAALATADTDAARAAIDVPRVWASNDVQSLGRLAGVYLRLAAVSDAERQRAALACASFLEAREPGPLRRDLPLGELAWDAARLDEIARSARDRLDAPPIIPPS